MSILRKLIEASRNVKIPTSIAMVQEDKETHRIITDIIPRVNIVIRGASGDP